MSASVANQRDEAWQLSLPCLWQWFVAFKGLAIISFYYFQFRTSSFAGNEAQLYIVAEPRICLFNQFVLPSFLFWRWEFCEQLRNSEYNTASAEFSEGSYSPHRLSLGRERHFFVASTWLYQRKIRRSKPFRKLNNWSEYLNEEKDCGVICMDFQKVLVEQAMLNCWKEAQELPYLNLIVARQMVVFFSQTNKSSKNNSVLATSHPEQSQVTFLKKRCFPGFLSYAKPTFSDERGVTCGQFVDDVRRLEGR